MSLVHSRRIFGAVALAGLLAASCASTTQRQAVRSGDELSSAEDDSGSENSAGTTVLSSGTATTATGAGPTGTAPGPVAPGGATATTRSGGRPPGNQPGVTDTEIHIGIAFPDDLGALGTFGVTSSTPSVADVERGIQFFFDDLNAKGGAAGRKLVPEFRRVKYITGGSFDSQSQAVCEHFTNDRKVFAVITAVNNHSTLLPSCLAQRRTVLIDSTNSIYFDDVAMSSFAGSYYRPNGLDFKRWGIYIDSLVSQGLLAPGDRIGLLRYDLPQQARVSADVIRPALAAHNLELVDEFAYSYITSSASVGEASSQSANAVLRFRRAGINRVIFLASQSPIPFAFMNNAEQQGYRPLYGITTGDLPNFLATNVPAAQLAGARGIGWGRSSDVPSQPWPESPSWRRCTDIMSASGLTQPIFGFLCDPFWFLQLVLDRVSVVSPEAMRSVVNGLGNEFTFASGFATRFGPNITMGAAGVRDIAFDGGCGCFQYVSRVRTVG